MLWDIRSLMKPALSVIDRLPDVHRTPALAVFRRALLEGKPVTFRLTDEDRELAFHDAHVQLTSPIGARVLRSLYVGGHLKLKKPAAKALPALDAYIATEAAFRADVERIIAADAAKRQRLAEIVADPAVARADEVTVYLVDKVISARLGHAATGTVTIAGLACHRVYAGGDAGGMRDAGRMLCWWTDGTGQRQGEAG